MLSARNERNQQISCCQTTIEEFGRRMKGRFLVKGNKDERRMMRWRGECWLLRKKVILVEVYSPRRENIGVLQMFSSVFHMYWNLLSTLFCYLFPFSYSLSLIAARNVLSGQHSPRDDHWDFNGFFDNFWKIKIKPLYQPFLLKLHQDISFMSKKSKCFFSSVYLCGEQVLLFFLNLVH